MTFEPILPTTERRQAFAAFSVLLVIMAGHTALETARDSLFLSRLPVSQLPYTYVAIAVAALLAAELDGRLRAHFAPKRLLSLTLLVGALGTAGFFYGFQAQLSWAPHAFYVFIAVIATLVTVQFWLLLSELFTVLEAKRVYTLISAGGLLGAMLGGALSRFTADAFGDLSLLGLGAGLFLLGALCPRLLRVEGAREGCLRLSMAQPPTRGDSHKANVRDLRTERYLQRLLAITLLATVAATLIDYVFKAQVARSLSASELGVFFGTFSMWQNGAALLVQLLLAPRLLQSGGVGRSLLLVPALLSVGASVVLLAPSLLSVLLLRGSDGALRFAVHRSSLEMLYLPLSPRARARWKMVVDVLGQRGGQALGAGVIFACLAAELGVSQIAVVLLSLTLGWLWLSSTMEARYVALFRAKIKAGAIETRAEVPALDMRSLESLVAALGSESDDEVLATIDLLVDYDRAHVIPSLLLHHPSREVVMRTLEVFGNAGRRDFEGAARRLLLRDDEEIRAAAMLTLAGSMQPAELRAELDKALPMSARAAVLVAMLARGLDRDGRCALEADAGCEPEAELATRLAFARAFRLQGDVCCAGRLPNLLVSAPPELELEAVRAMAAIPQERYVQPLIAVLRSRSARSVARDALVRIGEPALRALGSALHDEDLPRQLRAHVPRSVSRFGSAAAADVLLDRLPHEGDGWVRFKIIRGLGQLREHLGSHGRSARVLAAARENLVVAVHFLEMRLGNEADMARDPSLLDKGGELLQAVLRDKEAHAVDRAVRLVGLMHNANVIHNIRQALGSRDARLRADSIELLVHRAPTDIAQALSVLSSAPRGAAQLARAAEALDERLRTLSYETRLELLLGDDSEAVRVIAAYHVGELGLHALSPALVPAAEHSSKASREVFTRASELLQSLPPLARPRSAS